MADTGVVEFTNHVPVSQPHEEDETLSANERAQMDALRGDDPAPAPVAEKAAEEPEVPVITDKPVTEAVEAAAPAKAKKEPRVPLAEVQKERERRQALEKELADYRDKFARGDERLRLIQEQVAAAQTQQQQAQQANTPVDPEPNKEADLFAWQEWKNRQLEAAIAQRDEQLRYLYEQTQQTQQERQQAQYRDQYQSYVQSNEQAFATQNPQYFPAIDALRNHVDKLFSFAIPDPGQRAQEVAMFTDRQIRWAAQHGKNPAEVFYNMAKEAGFSEAAAQQVAAETQAVANVANGRPTMGTVQRAQHATRTLSNVAGAPTAPPASVNDLANMTEEQWEAYRERVGGDKALGRIYGQR